MTKQFLHNKQSMALKVRNELLDNREHLVVPVVMAIAGVEMNGHTISADELIAQHWNGRPVTVGHPQESDAFVSASANPSVFQNWSVGQLFNSEVTEDGKLKAEAYLDQSKLSDDLKQQLAQNENMDVSTGMFADITANNEMVNIRPDHLALLPNEEGACNFEDGCGVRANKLQVAVSTIKKALGFETNCNCTINEGSKMADKPENNDAPTMNVEQFLSNLTDAQRAELKQQVLSEAEQTALSEAVKAHEARQQQLQAARAQNIEKIKAHTKLGDEALNSFDDEKLEVLANGLKPDATYVAPATNNAGSDDVINAMKIKPLFGKSGA